jgi:hypothetical protein
MPDLSAVPEVGIASANHFHYRRRVDAAAYVTERYFPCSPKTLAKLAVTGGGPVFRKAGRIPVYDDEDLNRWAIGRISQPMRSTSEMKGAE